MPKACASCHGTAVTIIDNNTTPHLTSGGCGSTAAGCHFAATPTPTPTASTTPTPTTTAAVAKTKLTLKVAPTTIKLRKTVKATGLATAGTTLGSKKVALKVEMKKGAKWVKAKAVTIKTKVTGAYSWTYKPGKKGTYRVKASVIKGGTYTAATARVRTFKVK